MYIDIPYLMLVFYLLFVFGILQPHKRKHSNLVQGNDVEDWDPYELTKEQREMKEAMAGMLDPLVQELKVEDTLMAELHTHEQEDGFMNMDNLEKWTKWEVASWLGDLKLDNYVVNFLKAGIDGGTLLFDMPREHMTHLGVGRVHQGKLERAINDLKKVCSLTPNDNNNST